MSVKYDQNLFNAVDQPLLICNASGTVLDINPAFESLMQCKAVDIIDSPVDHIFVSNDQPMSLTRLLNENSLPATVSLRGSEKSLLASVIPFQNEKQETVYCMTLKTAQGSSKAPQNKDAGHGEFPEDSRFATFGYLMPGIAHNINNPLAVIIGRTQLLAMKYPDIKGLSSIQEQGSQVKTIIDTLSYKASHELSDTQTEINITKLFSTELTILNADPFYKHHVSKHTDIDATTLCVQGKYKDLSSALLSLINYSLDSMLETDPKEFKIQLRMDGSTIIITISDSGKPAIPANSWLSQAPYRSTRMGRHTVDLSRARAVIEKCNGAIHLVHNNQDGKEIEIQIPGNKHAQKE